MIGQSSTLSTAAKEDSEEAREQLLDTIANYNVLITDEIVCVFDAYEQSGIEREHLYHGVKTILTKEKETVDSFMERYVYELYSKHTIHIAVVISDMSEQHATFGSGAYRIFSGEMWRELKEDEVVINKPLDDFSEEKPRIRILLPNEIPEESEKIRRGSQKKD